MTRLCGDDLLDVSSAWDEYAGRLRRITGKTLVELCALATNLHPHDIRGRLSGSRIGVVPVTAGEGIIEGFAESLASIADFLGCGSSFVLPPDKGGFDRARTGECDILLWADDDTFLAENMHTGKVCENGLATGRGFAAALESMAEKWNAGRRALVLGAGPVGQSAAEHLHEQGFEVVLCDTVPGKANKMAPRGCVGIEPGMLAHFGIFDLLLDAAPTDDCFPLEYLDKNALVSAPCVPCAWPKRLPDTCWHDPLQLGTAVMLAAAAE